MVHTILDLLEAWRTGVCSVHGTSSEECGAATEMYTILSSALIGGAIGARAGGRPGLVLGAMAGGSVGIALADAGELQLPSPKEFEADSI